MENALADFGSRILYPSRDIPGSDNSPLSHASLEKALQAATRAAGDNFDTIAREFGYGIGGSLYTAYLQGNLKPTVLRRLFLLHIEKPGVARKACQEMVSALRSARHRE
jgi:hypothetical protein